MRKPHPWYWGHFEFVMRGDGNVRGWHLFDCAVRSHRHGRIADAERAYIHILTDDSTHSGALHLLGVIRHQQGRHEEAMELIRRAIAAGPATADYHNNLGSVLVNLGRLAEAEGSFRRALTLRLDYADALVNLGLALKAAERAEEAVAAYCKAIRFYLDARQGEPPARQDEDITETQNSFRTLTARVY